jgi:hypothetical protein
MTPLRGPELFINYAPELDLSLTCVRVQKYEVASPEYRFEVNCRIRHPTGHFDYFADDVCFEPDSFAVFAEELRNIQRGRADSAALKSIGEMLVLKFDRTGRQLLLTLNIRDHIPLGKMANLSMAIDADYDLFVNKLGQKVEEFLADLREVKPSFN